MQNRPRMTISALLAALALNAGSAQAWTAQNDFRVDGDAAGFEVLSKGGGGAPAFWCAAGDFASKVLGLGPTDRVWRVSEPPRAGGEGIRFALSPDGAASKTGLLIWQEKDASVSVAMAVQFCWNPKADL